MLHTDLDIAVPPSKVWRLLIDTEAWLHWGPSVRAVDAPARHIGPGMRGRVQTTPGLWLPFEVTRWVPGREWAWRVAGIPATGHVVVPLGPARCCVSFTVPSWAPFYLPVCALALRRLRERAVEP